MLIVEVCVGCDIRLACHTTIVSSGGAPFASGLDLESTIMTCGWDWVDTVATLLGLVLGVPVLVRAFRSSRRR
jgi:hypothetical protein